MEILPDETGQPQKNDTLERDFGQRGGAPAEVICIGADEYYECAEEARHSKLQGA